MLRLPYLRATLWIAVLWQAQSALAQNRISNARSDGKAVVEHLLVRGTGDGMEVEIQTSGASVAPDTQAITGPDRIVVDFPGAIPAAELHALKVNQGVLKGVRSGLFFSNPPITRIVLDLTRPNSYRISTGPNAIVVKLGAGDAAQQASSVHAGAQLRAASLASSAGIPTARVLPVRLASPNAGSTGVISNAAMASAGSSKITPSSAMAVTIQRTPIEPANSAPPNLAQPSLAQQNPARSNLPDDNPSVLPQVDSAGVSVTAEPPKPAVSVSYVNGMLTIHSEKATLAQVLYEVHQQTQADIAIPAGAEQEQVVADLGPAPARDVLGALLNGSRYNFIFVGDELLLERVILTRRDPNVF